MTIGIALVPVLVLLALLQLMDSFKLVKISSVLSTIAAGATVALVCLPIHEWLMDWSALDLTTFMRYVAPATEEALKASFVLLLFFRRRIGFIVDAAVLGFATGAGFALVENIDYLWHVSEAPLTLWLVRGLGTAVLHGTTTSVLAMVTKALIDNPRRPLLVAALPGLSIAVGVHSAFNHVLLPPLATTALLLLILPIIIVVVFQQSERATREWVGAGLDLDVELLHLVRSEYFAATRFGGYLQELRGRFGGVVVADMFCLLRLELELSIQAKAMLLAREAGLDVPVDDDLDAAVEEIAYLRASIGRTGLLALKPLEVSSDRDQWHRYLLTAVARKP
jgi:RsiW-degrading membrane proteinase PrsW (M82 family)